MGFEVAVAVDGAVTVTLTEFDRVWCWRRAVTFAHDQIAAVAIERRDLLEGRIEHRAFGYGTHDGARRPGRRRVGSMLGRGARGPVFWAAGPGPPYTKLLVLHTTGHKFVGAVLEVEDLDAAAARLSS